MSGNAKLSQCSRLAGARQVEGPLLVGYARQKMKAHVGERQSESPLVEQPKEFLSGSGDYVVIVEEVKSTVQAR